MYTVYAIKSTVANRIYVGFTSDLKRRMREHNSGKTKSTKGFMPWKLIFTEEVEPRVLARIREKYWKSGIGKKKLKSLISDL
ncbi:GIY-YIG nuclease family protein [Echinicola vietnamensis]|uniref:Putative endonuclease containing a URI domain n=1 Tax=Echinicola vietnamensis (strain DSM 17526 / LMG 23754 / KMM 6221) TaxID=926556 RepID=L0FX60_ECHVK|nr:GIY-YIG nuclease family protein [Echinicola vietnamensis]AGA77613.1 putative endonuclease containing a URI domain [Echinicola vietnamensis DSM 17526]